MNFLLTFAGQMYSTVKRLLLQLPFKLLTVTAVCLFPFVHSVHAQSPDSTQKVYVFEINEDIFKNALRLVNNAMEEADLLKCDIVLIKLNTFGGELNSADSIRARLINANQRTLVWIQHNAASAGALIALACDSIYMRADAKIGAASVVDQEGNVLADKFQSYMRGMMRSTAEQNGRDPKIAEGMVTPNAYLPEIADTGKIITLTAKEALQYDYCDGIVESMDEVLKMAHVSNYKIIQHKTTWIDGVLAFLLNPFVNGILLMLILGGIYFEFQHPGAAFPILTAAVAAVLYFAPLYLEGLAEHWEILLFIIGIGLVILEFFVVPGFGVPGIAGISLIIGGLTLALLRNVSLDFSMTAPTDVLIALLRVILPLGIGFFLFLAFGPKLFQSRFLKGFVLTDTQEKSVGYIEKPDELKKLIGKNAIAITSLRPSGSIELDGDRYDAMADVTLVNAGEKVRVIDVSGNILVVRKV